MMKVSILVTLLFAGVQAVDDQCDGRKPNLLHIVLDQLRYDCIRFIQDRMPEYDAFKKIETPNMDRLFERSAVFEDAYCYTAVCTPARAVLKTGTVLQRVGAYANHLMKRRSYILIESISRKVANAVTFDHVLKQLGYQVETYGKWHLPHRWYRDKDHNRAFDYDHYDFENDEFGLRSTFLFAPKYRQFAPYLLERDNQTVSFDSTYSRAHKLTGYPYEPLTPVTGLTGRDKLSRNYTYTAVLGRMASKALERLVVSNSSFSIAVHFLAPHAPWIVNDHHLSMYLPFKDELHVPASLNDTLENSPYTKTQRWGWVFQTEERRQTLQAAYYALTTEVDDWIGVLLDQIEAAGLTNCTLISLTSDHGEMMGAHKHFGKGVFYAQSIKVPWGFSLPGVIPVGVFPDPVSHLDNAATILDYLNTGIDVLGDGKSLRRYLDYQGINKEKEECFVVSEMEKRIPINSTYFPNTAGSQPELMIVHRGFKLMMPKRGFSKTLDMLINMRDDPEEMNNLVGLKGENASLAVIGRAEHLKVLLIDYMQQHDGALKVYSDPNNYFNDTRGDLFEIIRRRKWRKVALWISEWGTFTFGRPFLSNGKYVRTEYLYLGRTIPGSTEIFDIIIEGDDKEFYSVEKTAFSFARREHVRVAVTYKNDNYVSPGTMNATLTVHSTMGTHEVQLAISANICP